MINKPVIVVVAYNRPEALKRLLKSVANANYPETSIPIIISIDKASSKENQEVLKVAQDFTWNYGEKKIESATTNLGLRKHILQCGNYSFTYGSVIILEDDLYVSKSYYHYAMNALSFSADKEYIGGVSLYNHQFNVNTNTNFSPIEDGYDNWYFQFASSWGQAWNANQWSGFIKWYTNNKILEPNERIPENVTRWSKKSWLKYYIYYLVTNDKYFLYPKIAFSTNFNDTGTHITEDTTIFQVPLQHIINKPLHFSSIKESNAIYDVFFENKKLTSSLGINEQEICIDLFASKKTEQISKQFLLSTKILNHKIIKSYGKKLKPMDANIYEEIPGKDIFLYDTSSYSKNPYTFKVINHIKYNIKYISNENSKLLFKYSVIQQVKKIISAILGKIKKPTIRI